MSIFLVLVNLWVVLEANKFPQWGIYVKLYTTIILFLFDNTLLKAFVYNALQKQF